jgi:RNA polymerase sigma-70 factor (ECF subfamily)
MTATLTVELIRRAVVERDQVSIRSLVQTLTPIVHTRVGYVLLRRAASAHGRNQRQEVEDMVQEVFEMLLADDGRRLLAWDPERGSAATFFGLIAERCVLNILTNRKKNPWTEDPEEEDSLDRRRGTAGGVEERVMSRELLRELGRRLLEGLNERDQKLFVMVYLEQADDEQVREELGLARDAMYQARHRLGQRVRKLMAEIEA